MLRISWLLLLIPLLPASPRREKLLETDGPYRLRRMGKLDERLSEISGWTFVNDSTLIAHNDSGNEPLLYVLGASGKILKTVRLEGTANVDFEDIAFDGKNMLYLGDFGNNNNTRKDLAIYGINLVSLLSDSVVTTTKIAFRYPDQQAFPPGEAQLYYDAEALAFGGGKLWIVTKCRTKPFDGLAKIYSLDPKGGEQDAREAGSLVTGKGGWLKDAVTGACFHGKDLFLLTYSRVMRVEGFPEKPVIADELPAGGISQKEAIAVDSQGKIYIADERRGFLGGKILTLSKNTK
jgi:hypothetical protein